MITAKIKSRYRKIFPCHRSTLMPQLLEGCESVLDLGCGRTSFLKFYKPKYAIGVDLFEPYLAQSKSERIHDEYILSDVLEVEFEPNSFDAVVCTEVLEHISKKKGHELIEKMKRWAKKRVLVTTTNGFCVHEVVDDNELQCHKSGWTVDELEDIGFKLFGIRGWIGLRKYYDSDNKAARFLAERASDITQKITYRYPKASHRVVGVYQVK